MINITICDSTPTKELASATATLKKMYEERRNAVFSEIVEFLRNHPDAAFTARELSNSCGLPVPTLANMLNTHHYIGRHKRIITRTFYALNEDDTPNFDDKVTQQFKINEYFYEG